VIFLTVGTNHARFDRLLAAFDDWDGREELVVQHGPSEVRPAHARCSDFLSFEENLELIEAARVVVTHAGVGSVLLALEHDKRPVVVARLHRFGEAVDDHQQAFAERLAREGLVRLVDLEREGPDGLLAALDEPPVRASTAGSLDLCSDLRSYVEAVTAR
jgi:UDP-N-acetylglucosamine transferase subunit ALG13